MTRWKLRSDKPRAWDSRWNFLEGLGAAALQPRAEIKGGTVGELLLVGFFGGNSGDFGASQHRLSQIWAG